jgi:glyoxylase-like metal-dependent hydrolase (beta-lactamase superfamily II)
MESEAAMNGLLEKEFSHIIVSKPITKVVFTHFHADHTFGIQSVLRRFPDARVYAHETLPTEFKKVVNVRGPITWKRGMFQFGNVVAQHVNSGVGPKLRWA